MLQLVLIQEFLPTSIGLPFGMSTVMNLLNYLLTYLEVCISIMSSVINYHSNIYVML